MPKLTLFVYHQPGINQSPAASDTNEGLTLNLNTVLTAMCDFYWGYPANSPVGVLWAILRGEGGAGIEPASSLAITKAPLPIGVHRLHA